MPDFRSHRIVSDDDSYKLQAEMVEELKTQGATSYSITYLVEDKILIIDGWKIKPKIQEPAPKLEDVIGFGR